jgi:L-idonate 5-dehydrogenase
MKAAVIHAARDLRVEDVSPPVPGPGEVAVRIRAGGICGSDLHYYQDGGFGTVRIKEPFIPGHEMSGEVIETGPEVTKVKVGDRVAVNPSRPCGHCEYCLEGKPRHCLDMRFFGSAMRFPHVQGGFREVLVCAEEQAVRIPDSLSLELAAFAEPLSVCLHAGVQAGPLLGKRVLVTGAGPIGALSILVARHGGARTVVATDLADAPLKVAKQIGADECVNVRSNENGLDRFSQRKGFFDIVFEASGSGAALGSAITVARPGAIIVQLGLGGDISVPINTVVAKEVDLRGSFRFDAEFPWALDFIASGAIDVAPLLTEVVPIDDAVRAFELAGDRSRAMKVQVAI